LLGLRTGDTIGIYWVAARNVTKHPTMHKIDPPQQRIAQTQMSKVPRLSNPSLDVASKKSLLLTSSLKNKALIDKKKKSCIV